MTLKGVIVHQVFPRLAGLHGNAAKRAVADERRGACVARGHAYLLGGSCRLALIKIKSAGANRFLSNVIYLNA